ncbi:hypothetical protein I302_103487 [Kwoniella bestiolae CBS 10118]|uniref:Uncharacterized protein n=1 Tax=Kwoniella bestiolae CBS 10118 TaxID=1296100 RepID=A0A1B9G8J4_9TREE|nr:hypothetical protein I302_02188 [Kwoniella bestiolae CBS 10118]OCF27347.1 hypothetical protein I302_02188 [Kwoniella bestiolae CBS 10118]
MTNVESNSSTSHAISLDEVTSIIDPQRAASAARRRSSASTVVGDAETPEGQRTQSDASRILDRYNQLDERLENFQMERCDPNRTPRG